MAITDFERYPLTFGPSPVHTLARLTEHLGGAAILAKREDCSSGLAFGGTTTGKLEHIVPDVLASGADTRLDPAGFDIGIHRSWHDALDEVEADGGKPYAIPRSRCSGGGRASATAFRSTRRSRQHDCPDASKP